MHARRSDGAVNDAQADGATQRLEQRRCLLLQPQLPGANIVLVIQLVGRQVVVCRLRHENVSGASAGTVAVAVIVAVMVAVVATAMIAAVG